MAKFFGEIGYGISTEVKPGVWKDIMHEVAYRGDVIRNTRQLVEGQSVNDDISVNNSISIVADEFASGHFFAIRYIRWMGALWKVASVDVQSPRLLLRLGGVYNGPVANPSSP